MAKLAVIIPCYNEEASIGRVLQAFPRAELQRHRIQLRLFVVDNNSSDATASVATEGGATVVREPKQGKGNALRAGFRVLPADTDFVVMLDGDNTYDPAEIMRLVEPLASGFCDAVIGSRLGGRIQIRAMSRLNRLGNRLFTTIVRLLYGANVSDVLTGYFAWKKSALDTLAPHVKSQGFAIEMEMITKMTRLGLNMASVPISYHPRVGQSNLCPLRDGWRILMMLLHNLTWRPAGQRFDTATQQPLGKIVFVSDAIYPYMKGGKEKRLFEISTRLAQRGYDVHIYTMHWWHEAAASKSEHGVHLHAICKYHPMYAGERRTIKEAILFSLACLKLLWVRFDILDVDHMPFFPVLTTWLVCKVRGKKLHATWHETLTRREWIDYMGTSGAVASVVEHLSTKLPHRITAASAQTKESLALTHGRNGRVELVTSGIDSASIARAPAAQVRCDVLYVGRLVKDKNIGVLIEAMSRVTKQYRHARCLIIGEGPEKARLQGQSAKLELENNVAFLGPLPQAVDVYAHMKAAKVFCSPSVREGFGIATLEALSCGTPVITIASPSNAARHMVRNGQNGSIVPLEPDAIAEAIIHWLSATQKPAIDPQLAKWDWHYLAERQAEVYSL